MLKSAGPGATVQFAHCLIRPWHVLALPLNILSSFQFSFSSQQAELHAGGLGQRKIDKHVSPLNILSSFQSGHRRSQGGQRGHGPPEF